MCFIFAILALLAGGTALVVLLSYAIVWYERANLDQRLLDDRFSTENLRLAGWLLLQETACLFLTVLLHPLGWFSIRENEVEYGSGTPVLLLHGLFHNRSCWLWTAYRLRRSGLRNVHTLALPPWHELEVLTELVARKVDELRHSSGSDRIHIVGHSMGGMIARNFIQLRDGAAKVESCVLLSCPNGGSKLAPFTVTHLGSMLLPGSDFLERLAAAPLPADVRTTAIYSRHDNMVIPFEAARLQGAAAHVEFAGIGHVSMLYSPRAFEALYDALAEKR